MTSPTTLTFTAHCQVRYIERFVDKDAVVQARRAYKVDGLVLQALEEEFAWELRRFRHCVQIAYFNLLHRIGDFVAGVPYTLCIGPLSVCIKDGVCKTTVCKKEHGPRPSPVDDGPTGGSRQRVNEQLKDQAA